MGHDAPMKINPLHGVLMVLAAAMLWGTTGTAQSFAPPQLSAYWVGSLRLWAAALFFMPWLALTDRPALARRSLANLPWPAIGLAAACMCSYNLAFFAGVRACGVAVGTAIAIGSGPIWAGLLQALVLRRAPPVVWWLGTALAVAGVGMMMASAGVVAVSAAPGASFSLFGVAMCLLAGLSYAVYALVNKHMVSMAPAGVVTAAVFVLAAALAVPIAWALAGAVHLSAQDVAVVAWLGVMGTAVAYLLFSHALRHISGATAVALALGEPVTAFVLAIAVVGERPGGLALVGLLVVLAGLVVVVRAELVRQPLTPQQP
jgi:drug/metabolite transporter, DME family